MLGAGLTAPGAGFSELGAGRLAGTEARREEEAADLWQNTGVGKLMRKNQELVGTRYSFEK